MLQIKNVNLNIGNTALLSNINLSLEQGKIYGNSGTKWSWWSYVKKKLQIKYNQFSLFM